jgi:hypothetical protein
MKRLFFSDRHGVSFRRAVRRQFMAFILPHRLDGACRASSLWRQVQLHALPGLAAAAASFMFLTASPGAYADQPDVLPETLSRITREQVYNLPCTEPDWRLEPRRRSLIEPGHIVHVRLGAHRLDIPWAYLHPRPPSTHLNCNIARKSIGIQFWIPSLDAPERDLWFRGEWRPSETKRPNPRPNESVVKVTFAYFEDTAAAMNEVHAKRRIKNLLRLYAGSYETYEDLGMSRLRPSGDRAVPDIWFSEKEGKTTLYTCGGAISKNHPTEPNPRCIGYTTFNDIHLYVTFLLVQEAIAEHDIVEDGIVDLFRRWSLEKL